MLMLVQVLAPGVEHGEAADLCPEMLRVPSDVLEGLGDGAKEQAIELRLSRFTLAGPPTPRDTEASKAYAIIHDALGPVGICSLIGINSIVGVTSSHALRIHLRCTWRPREAS